SITPSPVNWHTAPETHAKVISIQSANAVAGVPAPCFRVYLPSGVMEEFGCTWNSLQYYLQSTPPNTGVPYIANWLLDLVTDTRGNQIHVTYQQDVATGPGGGLYPRDSQLATVEWDSPGCHDSTNACAAA